MATYQVGFKFHSIKDGHNYIITMAREDIDSYVAEQIDPDVHNGMPNLVTKCYSADGIAKRMGLLIDSNKIA